MSNVYYNHNDGVPAVLSRGASALIGSELDLIATGFGLLPSAIGLSGSSQNYAADTGSVNAVTVTAPPNVVAYADGLEIVFSAAHANTGAATIAVGSIGTANIVRPDGSALQANDFLLNQMVELRYSAAETAFQLMSIGPAAQAAAATSAAAAATSATAAAASATAAAASATAAAAAAVAAANAKLSLSVAGSSNVTLTAGQAANQIFIFTGALTGNIQVIFPQSAKTFVVENSTSGAYTLTVIMPSGTGIAVPQGIALTLLSDATNVIVDNGIPTATSSQLYKGTGAPGVIAAATAGVDYGFDTIPQNSQSAAYTTVLADSGKHIFHPSGDANARTFTIDSNANVAYKVGTAINFINMSANNVTIAITSDTLTLSPAGTTGSRTLAQYGCATALKITSTSWIITGTGLT